MVEGVKEFGAELERRMFLEGGLLRDREIPIVDAGTSNIVTGQISIGKQRNARLAKGIGARILIGTGGANEIGGIKPKISSFRSVAGSVAVSDEGLLRISGLMRECDRTDNVGTIQVVILLARVGIGVKVDWLTGLKRYNSIELPTSGNFSEQCRFQNGAAKGNCIDAAEHKALWSIEVRNGAIEAVIVVDLCKWRSGNGSRRKGRSTFPAV